MFRCAVCYRDTQISNLKTIGDQIVCSLSCVSLLKSNSRDACDCCKYPVWRDNYFKINNRFYCSEFCKDKIIKNLKISNNSKLIHHFKENIFSDTDYNNNKNNLVLNNSKQLREEVMKFFKDFEFDTNIDEDEENNNYNKKSNNYFYSKNKYSKNNSLEKDNTNKQTILYTQGKNGSSYNHLKNKYINQYEVTKISNNSNNRKYTPAKSTSSIDMQISEDKINNYYDNKIKRINKYKISLNKNKINNANNNGNNVRVNLTEKFSNDESDNINILNNLNKFTHAKNYSFITTSNKKFTNPSPNKNYITNNKTPKKNGFDYNNINNQKSNKGNKECTYCGNKIGAATFFDRNNNRFCSDICKEEYFRYNNKL